MVNTFVAVHTLGCKVNQCDSEALIALLTDIGCVICNFNQIADIYIINTCTVTHASDRKSKQIIRRAKKLNPAAKVAVCGCMVQKDPTTLNELGVDYIFDARKPEEFIQEIAPLSLPEKQSNTNHLRTRAFIKIQDGCDRFCSYCIVPYVRGKPISRSIQDILAEAESQIKKGAQEIVLTGIQVSSYGDDTKDGTLATLISKISSLISLKRLRLSSIDPCAINDDFLAAVANSPAICDHFHLSLQSGCDTVLARMNRRYTSAEYTNAAQQLRKIFPNVALTTDIIVGFPGETDDEFYQSLTFAKKIGFARIHVFEYSKREGTAAATFANQTSDKIKSERGEKTRALAKMLQTRFYDAQVNKIVPVLFETRTAQNKWQGHTSNYCPVQVISNKNLANTIHYVEIINYTQDYLIGTILH